MRMYEIYLTYTSLCYSLAKTRQFCKENKNLEKIAVMPIAPALFQEGLFYLVTIWEGPVN